MKYYCKEKNCNNEICFNTWKYGSGLCRSCSTKKWMREKGHKIIHKKL